MLLDHFAPNPHFVARYGIEVAASADDAYRAIWDTDFGTSRVIRALWFLRTLPGRFSRRETAPRIGRTLTLQTLLDSGFGRLAEAPGREVVLGIVGRFWNPTIGLLPFRPEHFSGALPRGLAMAVWNFSVQEGGAGRARVLTETRVVCADSASRRKFGIYWTLVSPFSGLIRADMLRAIQRRCVGH